MPKVILARELSKRFVGDVKPIELPATADTVRKVITALDGRYPGIGAALSRTMTVAINGEIYENCLLEPVPADAEVCFFPPLDGG